MSTKVSIKWRKETPTQPGFHLYDDWLDASVEDRGGVEPPVYLELDGVAVQVETRPNGGASVALTLPRELARELGLVPARQGADDQLRPPGNP